MSDREEFVKKALRGAYKTARWLGAERPDVQFVGLRECLLMPDGSLVWKDQFGHFYAESELAEFVL